jgi:hypothetical protein
MCFDSTFDSTARRRRDARRAWTTSLVVRYQTTKSVARKIVSRRRARTVPFVIRRDERKARRLAVFSSRATSSHVSHEPFDRRVVVDVFLSSSAGFATRRHSQPRGDMNALTSRIAATPSTSRASRVEPPRGAPRRGAARRPARAASDVTVTTAPSTSTPSPAWTQAWRSVQDPSTRVAYVDDASRAALLAALDAGGLAEALETVDGEVHVRGEVRGSFFEARDEETAWADVTAADVSALGLARALLGGAQVEPAGARDAVAALERDICAVVSAFCAATGSASAVVAVSLLRRTLCSKYHVDHVPLRVMCTYLGAGTEVLSERASLAISLASDRAGRGIGDVAKAIVGSAADAPGFNLKRRSRECELVLLKGEKWPGNAGRAIVHRSPIIDGCCGEWRLCLKVDAPEHVNAVVVGMSDGSK